MPAAGMSRTVPSPTDCAVEYLEIVQHHCPNCNRAFEGESGFLDFMEHLDFDVACRFEFEAYLDAVRGDAGGS
ncbi:MAG: hypothetical protein ACYDDF_13980 [Thermoplasmatota archaeon]